MVKETGDTREAGDTGKLSAEGSIDTTKIKRPIIGFVFGQKGLMADASAQGSKFTKLKS